MNTYKYNLNFRLEKRKIKGEDIVPDKNLQILADITFNRKRFFYFIGYRIDKGKWIEKSETGAKIQRVKANNFNSRGESASVINSKIVEVEYALKKVFQKLEYGNITPTIDKVREELKTLLNEEKKAIEKTLSFWDIFQEYIDTAKVSEGRRRHITSGKNLFKRFEAKLGYLIIFDLCDPTLIAKFESFLFKEGTDPEKYKNLPKKDQPKRKSANRISSILKILRAFFNWAIIKYPGLIKTSPFQTYHIDAEKYGRPIYLTKQERDSLYTLEIDNERLRKVRDIFVFQCFIGCRVGDLIKLTKDNIINGAIEYIPRKTKDESPVVVRVPLSAKAKAILAKYDIPDGSLLPFISDQRYNEYLKELFKEAGLKRIVTRQNPLTRIEEKVPLYSIATSHMARRTFVGTLHRYVKDSVIASMSGHVEDSKAFSRYYDVGDDTKTDAINNFLD